MGRAQSALSSGKHGTFNHGPTVFSKPSNNDSSLDVQLEVFPCPQRLQVGHTLTGVGPEAESLKSDGADQVLCR